MSRVAPFLFVLMAGAVSVPAASAQGWFDSVPIVRDVEREVRKAPETIDHTVRQIDETVRNTMPVQIDVNNGRAIFNTPYNSYAVDANGRVVETPSPTRNLVENGVGVPLANGIWAAKSRITDARPIPPAMRVRLRGFGFGDATLRRAKYSLQWGVTQGLLRDATAVTLDDIIVFRSPDGVDDFPLWAHELVHVEQYAQMGVPAFAREYTLQHWTLENPAYDRQHQAEQAERAEMTDLPDQTSQSPLRNPYYQQTSVTHFLPTAMQVRVVSCVTPRGISTPFMGRPGAPCFMQTPWGAVFGTAR